MADLIAYQDGNWTGATTWKGVATGTGAKQATISASTNTTTSNVASSNFTIGNGTVCEGLLLHCNRVTTTGTVTVGLYLGTTLQREVTVNASDLPTAQSWVFFEFATTLTAGNGSTYNVRVRGSSGNNAAFFRDATAGNWARYIRNGTTATAAATDVTFICDELTGAGTKVDITVTMDSTASTAYGECNIGQGGILSFGTSASTNYILDLAGNLNVWGGGTLNIGTSDTPIPSTSTALLEFTNAVNVDRGLEALAGSTVNIFGATKTTTQTLLTADAASAQSVINVTSTSGWAANDALAIASTTRTATQAERRTITTVNSGTQVTLSSNLSFTHHGVAPYQGEVINLTRNVKVRGTSQILCAYINCAATAAVTCQYAEFYWLGSGTANKTGISFVTTSSGTLSFKFCSFYDFNTSATGVIRTASSGMTHSMVIEDCGFYVTGDSIFTSNTSGTPSIQRNYIIGTSGSSFFADLGGTIRDNRYAGHGMTLTEANATIGTFKDNVIHSANFGFNPQSDFTGVLDGCVAWRNSTNGFTVQGGNYTVTNGNFYHNGTANVQFYAGSNNIIFTNCTFNGGTGASLSAAAYHLIFFETDLVFDNCTFGNLQTAGTGFGWANNTALMNILFRKCTIADTVTILSQSNMLTSQEFASAIKFDKFNNTSGSHRTYKRYGRTESDQATFKTAAPSEALLPDNASNKLPSGSKKFAVASGTTATVNVWVNKSASYNGNQPRLIVKANIIAGITTDTVLDTMSVGTGTWEELSGTTATVSDNCVLEVFVDCDGTAGTVYVDDWSVT